MDHVLSVDIISTKTLIHHHPHPHHHHHPPPPPHRIPNVRLPLTSLHRHNHPQNQVQDTGRSETFSISEGAEIGVMEMQIRLQVMPVQDLEVGKQMRCLRLRIWIK